MKHYVDIERAKEKYMAAFTTGEHVVVSEKIDGANASVYFDAETGMLRCFSRKTELSADNTLRGFWDFVQTLDVQRFAEMTQNGRYIVFGEWLVSHSVKYPQEVLNKFYVFDLWDTETEQYTAWTLTKAVADALNLNTVPVFYDGQLTSWEDMVKFVGHTEMGGEYGEGIVIKSQVRLDNRDSRTPAYVKIVAKEFSEVAKRKPHEVDPEKLAAKERAIALAETIITPRRVEKLVEKMIDEGTLPMDWDESQLGVVAKVLPRAVYEDCIKEEPETVEQIEGFSKICSSITMKIARELATR